MCEGWGIVLFVLSAMNFAGGQQATSAAPSPLPDEKLVPVKVYGIGSGVTAPLLLPSDPIQIFTGKCKPKQDGKVLLSLIVDETGHPRNITFLRALGSDLDKLALLVAASDRFNPGTHDGKSAAVAESVEIGLQGCILQSDDHKTYSLRLRSQPVQSFASLPKPPGETAFLIESKSPNHATSDIAPLEKIADGVSVPVLMSNSTAEFTPAARAAGYQGKCLLSLIVDRNGMPRSIQVIKSLDYGLDQNAVNAVNKYRFKPAMKDGQPVPVKINVEINFRLG